MFNDCVGIPSQIKLNNSDFMVLTRVNFLNDVNFKKSLKYLIKYKDQIKTIAFIGRGYICGEYLRVLFEIFLVMNSL
jgi:hypothetical protein